MSQKNIFVPEILAEVCGEHEVDERIGGRVEGREALDEGGDGDDGLVGGDQVVRLQHVEDDVRGPTQDEHCNISTFIIVTSELTRAISLLSKVRFYSVFSCEL